MLDSGSSSGFNNSHTSIPSSRQTISSVLISFIPDPFLPPSNLLTFHGPGNLHRSASSCWLHPFSRRNLRNRIAIVGISILISTASLLHVGIVAQKGGLGYVGMCKPPSLRKPANEFFLATIHLSEHPQPFIYLWQILRT